MKKKAESNKKGALPSTVGAILESTIHGSFSTAADGLYGLGYLNQIQRVALSSAIGTALETFTKEAKDLSNILVQPCDVDMLMGDDEDDGGDQADPMQSGEIDMSGMQTGMMSEGDPTMPVETMTPEQKRKKMLKEKLDAQMMMDMGGKKAVNPVDAKKAAIDELTQYILSGAKSLYDRKLSDYAWFGLSHNAWQDRENDIIPMALIENDIAVQRNLIKAGKMEQYGMGLLIDHNTSGPVIGDCKMREMIPGGRSCVEMGNLKAEHAGIKARTMSIGYWYGVKSGEYSWVTVYERSALVGTKAINARTLFSVKRREIISDAAMSKSIDELVAAMEE